MRLKREAYSIHVQVRLIKSCLLGKEDNRNARKQYFVKGHGHGPEGSRVGPGAGGWSQSPVCPQGASGDGETVETVSEFILGGLQNHCRW